MGQEYPEYYGSEGYGAAQPDQDADPSASGSPFDYSDYAGSYGEEESGPVAGPDFDVDPLGGEIPGASISGFTDNASGAMTLANSSSYNWLGGLLRGESSDGAAPARRGGGQVTTSAVRAGELVRSIRAATGLRISARGIVGLIVKYGFPAAAALTRLGLQDLLFLFMREKGVRHHRRGPGLYTVARKLRAAASLQRTVARILGRGGGGYRRHRRAPPYHVMRRRSRRRR